MEETPEDKVLLEFWKTVPVLKTISYEIYQNIGNHSIRDLIIAMLRNGVKTEGGIRHALSAQELLPYINEHLKSEGQDKPLKLTALYYHLKKLEDDGLIIEVHKILRGKKYVRYYGRTAKLFIADSEGKSYKNKDKLIELFNYFGADQDHVEQLINDFQNKKEARFNMGVEWIREHEDAINFVGIDVLTLLKIIETILPWTEEEVSLSRQLCGILGLDF